MFLMLLEGATVMVARCTGCLIARRDQRTAECNGCGRANCAPAAGADDRRLHQILYLGEHGLPGATLDAVVDDIRAETAERAQMFGLSGALMLTKRGFAQLLEGPRAEVENCLAALRSDPHHANALVLEEGDVGVRQFDGWSVSYADPASFVGRVTLRAITSAAFGARNEINRLVRLMLETGGRRNDNLGAALQSVAGQAQTSA